MVRLGAKVTDRITGLTGYATSITNFLNGNVQIGIQPKSDDPSKIADPWSVDHHAVIEVEDAEHMCDSVIVPSPEAIIPLGTKVVDTISGYTGITTKRATYMNGCVQYLVVAQVDPNKPTEIPCDWLSSVGLEVVDVGVSPAHPETTKGSGGPSERAARQV